MCTQPRKSRTLKRAKAQVLPDPEPFIEHVPSEPVPADDQTIATLKDASTLFINTVFYEVNRLRDENRFLSEENDKFSAQLSAIRGLMGQ